MYRKAGLTSVKGLWLSGREFFLARLNLVELPDWATEDNELCRRYDELWLRSFVLSQQESLAERIEALSTETLTDDQERFRVEMLAMYIEDVGAPPAWRHELESRISASIARGCAETLAQILTTLTDHGSSPPAASPTIRGGRSRETDPMVGPASTR